MRWGRGEMERRRAWLADAVAAINSVRDGAKIFYRIMRGVSLESIPRSSLEDALDVLIHFGLVEWDQRADRWSLTEEGNKVDHYVRNEIIL